MKGRVGWVVGCFDGVLCGPVIERRDQSVVCVTLKSLLWHTAGETSQYLLVSSGGECESDRCSHPK